MQSQTLQCLVNVKQKDTDCYISVSFCPICLFFSQWIKSCHIRWKPLEAAEARYLQCIVYIIRLPLYESFLKFIIHRWTKSTAKSSIIGVNTACMTIAQKEHRTTQYPQISFYNLCTATGLHHLPLTVLVLYQQTQLLLKLLQRRSKSNHYSFDRALDGTSKFRVVEMVNSCIVRNEQP